jgi:hypothetical protein
MAGKASGAGKKHSGKRQRRSVKNTDKKKKREYDKWVEVRAKLHEADVERKRQIKTS